MGEEGYTYTTCKTTTVAVCKRKYGFVSSPLDLVNLRRPRTTLLLGSLVEAESKACEHLELEV